MVDQAAGPERPADGRLEPAGHLAAARAGDPAGPDLQGGAGRLAGRPRDLRLPRPGNAPVHGRAARPQGQAAGGDRRHLPGRRRRLEGRPTRASGRGTCSTTPWAAATPLNPGDIKQNTRDFRPPRRETRATSSVTRSPSSSITPTASARRSLILNGHVDDTTIAVRLDRRDAAETPIVSTLMYLPAPPGASFFNPLVLRIEDFFQHRQPPYPVERTLLDRRHPRRRPREPRARPPTHRDPRPRRDRLRPRPTRASSARP